MEKIVELQNLTINYGSTIAVNDISLTINRGDFVGLVGPNGGGKTSLTKVMLGLLDSYKGQIKLFGKDIKNFNDYAKIGYLPQKSTAFNQLFPASVREIVMLGLLSQKKWPKMFTVDDDRKISQLLDKLGIKELSQKLVSDLSGGQQQKVLLARSLISNPELLVLDEPSTALDPTSRDSFFKFLSEINKEKKVTIILITHDTGYVGEYANKLLYIDRKMEFFGDIHDFCPSGDMNSCFEKKGNHIIWHQHT